MHWLMYCGRARMMIDLLRLLLIVRLLWIALHRVDCSWMGLIAIRLLRAICMAYRLRLRLSVLWKVSLWMSKVGLP